jgi:peroxiredoxin
MKIKALLLLVICFCLATSCKKDNILELPITYHPGFGPFEASRSGADIYSDHFKDNPWEKTHLKVSGIPQNWIDAKVGQIQSDMEQYVYQSYHLGEISREWYEEIQKMWDWEPDTLNLSKQPIKTRAAFAIGNDSVGNTMIVVDSNNNYDFSDDVPFELVQYESELDLDSRINNEAKYVTFERLLNNKKIKVEIPILLSSVNMDEYYLSCNFAQYRTAKLGNHLIYIYSRNNFPYRNIGIASSQSPIGEKIDFHKLTFETEYIEIGAYLYKNLGVKRDKDILLLEKIDLPKNEIRSTQAGFKAIDFSGNQFKRENIISLDNLKGKYVLLDFWGTWCGPCIQEIPNLKTLYDNIDKSNFEIISIVVDSPKKDLEQLMSKYGITWPQIISDDSNTIKEKYGIMKYPSTFLLSPEGVIIAKDLRGKELKTKIESLLKKASRSNF